MCKQAKDERICNILRVAEKAGPPRVKMRWYQQRANT
jgi:hypothetical protein